MHYSEIKTFDIANGVGVRTSVFVSGCERHCKGCFNSETWDFNHGIIFNDLTIKRILKSMKPQYIAGLSILGGEPLDPKNRAGVLELILATKEAYPDKSIWMWTGYTWEEIREELKTCSMLPNDLFSIIQHLDVLVDGPFDECSYNMMLRFRGSSNQRIIDIPKTLESGYIALWSDGPELNNHDSFLGCES